MKKFKLDLNLDSDHEDFLAYHGTNSGRRLANRLGLKGRGSSKLATALSNYAWNKSAAVGFRLQGEIKAAIDYERVCDIIYKRDILPFCECW